MNKSELLKKIKGGLIVSCQALKEEPLHSSYIMGRMAYAAMCGGAVGIRANTVEDIAEIQKNVTLPIIGIIKQVYLDSAVFITPTEREVATLIDAGVSIIATDATCRLRPNGESLDAFFARLRARWPEQIFMADCATAQEAIHAEKIGFDIVSTTLCGYTDNTIGTALPNFPMIEQIVHTVKVPIVVEGGIWDAATFARVYAIPGVHSVVIGSAITRPMEITKHFLKALQN